MSTLKINKKSTSLRINSGLYAYIEKLAKEENRSINNYIETLLFDAVNYQDPNEETRKSIEEARKIKYSSKGYSDINLLFEDLAR